MEIIRDLRGNDILDICEFRFSLDREATPTTSLNQGRGLSEVETHFWVIC